jgi:DNA repair ATPase RecN
MLFTYFSNLPRRFRIFGLLFLLTLVAYILWSYFSAQRVIIPREFLEAKGRGAAEAEEIVRLSRETSHQLAHINELDSQGNYVDALNLVVEELNRNRTMRERASALSRELTIMTNAVAQISGTEARSNALQAVNYAVALMAKLVTYNEYLNQLLETLRRKFEGIPTSSPTVGELIAKINEEVSGINALNTHFLLEISKLERKAR